MSDPTGWRLWLRLVAFLLCLSMAAAALLDSAKVDGQRCGSRTEALQLPTHAECANMARFLVFGSWLLGLGAYALLLGAVHRRRPGPGDEGT